MGGLEEWGSGLAGDGVEGERERMWGEIAEIEGKAFVELETVQRKLCTTS